MPIDTRRSGNTTAGFSVIIGEVIHDACSAVVNRITLLISHHMAVDSQRYPWVTVPQLSLHHSWGCAVCKQSTGRTVPHGMEPTTGNAQPFQQRVKLLFP